MFETMKQSFAGHADIEVILDRRRRERRWQSIPIEVDRRARERRTTNIDPLLRYLGWVVVNRTTWETAGPAGITPQQTLGRDDLGSGDANVEPAPTVW